MKPQRFLGNWTADSAYPRCQCSPRCRKKVRTFGRYAAGHNPSTDFGGVVGPNKGRIVPEDQRRAISRSVKKARRSWAPVWNKGLTKKDHPSIASMAKKLAVSMKGIPRPFVSRKQGIRRFWYFGNGRIKMRSRWEVAYAHWLDSQKIVWLYEAITFVGNQFSYTPDFYLVKEKKFIEIKGSEYNLHEEKINALRNRWRVSLDVLYGKDLQKLGILDGRLMVVAKDRRCI